MLAVSAATASVTRPTKIFSYSTAMATWLDDDNTLATAFTVLQCRMEIGDSESTLSALAEYHTIASQESPAAGPLHTALGQLRGFAADRSRALMRVSPASQSLATQSVLEQHIMAATWLNSHAEYIYWLGVYVRFVSLVRATDAQTHHCRHLSMDGSEGRLRTLFEELLGAPGVCVWRC